MRRFGRVNWIFVSLLALGIVLGALFLFSGEAPTNAAARFMSALSVGDAKVLADMSYFNPERPKDEVLKAWQKSLEISKYYRFVWSVKSSKSPVPGRSSVKLEVTRDADKSTAYPENFALDMILEKGKWLVDVRSLSREMYPALPR